MIRFTLTTNTEPLKTQRAFLDNIQNEVRAIGEGVLAEVKPELLDSLTDEPARPHRDIEWTPAADQSKPPNTKFGYYSKQMAAYFATDGFGGGIPSRRTGAIANAWGVTGQTKANQWALVVQNANPAARYLYGTLAKNKSAAMKPQQRFHRITGWPLASPIVQNWSTVAQTLFREQWRRRLADVSRLSSSGRAYTSPRRR